MDVPFISTLLPLEVRIIYSERPNILFVTAEDMCPHLGCYGDTNSRTPYLDHFANESIRFDYVFSVHPCCSPSRSCLATGVYPTRLGTFQHRGRVKVAMNEVRTLSSLLREHGYYCFNGMKGGDYKTDYNFNPEDDPWDAERSKEIEWRNRKPGQPFFGQVNLFQTHQSQYGRRKPGTYIEAGLREPSTLHIPPFHPDTPAVREIWAEYYDRVSLMDEHFSYILNLLDNDGLTDQTIVIFLGDNGMGVPAGKTWLWDQGLHVPMIVRLPNKWRHLSPFEPGEVSDQIVSFVDFAPTLLTMTNIQVPSYMKGIPFMGSLENNRKYAFAARDYHEGADYDTSRAVRSRQYHYIRNFMPQVGWDAMPYSWDRAPYMLEEWRQCAERGMLLEDTRQAAFFRDGKPAEELYDMVSDPYQMCNLAGHPEYLHVLEQMRGLCEDWMIENCDLGLMSQYELYTRSNMGTPYEMGSDPLRNPIQRLIACANIANYPNMNNVPLLLEMANDPDCIIRRWGAIGLLALGKLAAGLIDQTLLKLLQDTSADVRLTAAEALFGLDYTEQPCLILIDALSHESRFVRAEALMIMTRVGSGADAASPYLDRALELCNHMGLGSFDLVPGSINMARSCLNSSLDKIPDNYHMIDYKASRMKYF